MPRLYVDLDGVLADFDQGYRAAFGVETSREADNVDWKWVEQHGSFFKNLPLMYLAQDFMWSLRKFRPTILSGVPIQVPLAHAHKHEWVKKKFPNVPLITCLSKDKHLYCQSGDILIDDWPKYQSKWTAAGGHWITYTNPVRTYHDLERLNKILNSPLIEVEF